MKFKDIPYKTLDEKQIKKDFEDLTKRFKEAQSFEDQEEIFYEVNNLRKTIDTMSNLVEIRSSIDTNDAFYEKELQHLDQISPLIEESFNHFLDAFLASDYIEDFEESLGKNCIEGYRLRRKVFSSEILKELQEENLLSSEYDKVLGNLEVSYEGKTYPLTAFGPFLQQLDRKKRKEAHKAIYKALADKQDQIDEIYHKLVQLRDKMAKKLGYKNFVAMGYHRLGRTDYNEKDVKVYRDQIKEILVPVAQKLIDKQAERLGIDDFYYYDAPVQFLSGNPIPKGDPQTLIAKAQKMYDAMDPNLGEFFKAMVDGGYMDVEAKPGKTPGGFCTFIENAEMPFIFSNFNGTSGDIDVLTHEFGHALQSYMSRDVEPLDLRFPGYEGAEIHSMSMEYLTYPHMELFFEEDTPKYKYSHTLSNLMFLPYGATIDEFQHWVYENPQVSAKERRQKYAEIEKTYMPWKNYGDNTYLNEGGFWHKQGHLFAAPFYYIDYTLASNIAMQIYGRYAQDRKKTFEDYLLLCSQGGRLGFVDLVKSVDLISPFEKGSLEKAIKPLTQYLEAVNDKEL